MESNRSKRRGFTKSKQLIMSIYRATKPSSAALQPYSSKPKSSPLNSSDLEHVANDHEIIKPKAHPPQAGFIIVNQDKVFPQQKPKVAFVVPHDRNNIGVDSYDGGNNKLENFFYASEDEAVDAKAARYISSVQERFRLERTNSERINIQELQL
ncbi:hypothetical protein BUALT_Bualt16G0001500 [Buddleja alternifolia]|uniref:Uncharacterized protein n=1 Tax=Buddleja alternifolia TaxID=168488 RepID=A0AAV6W7U0_9LAMI|nr:hypothetical protein BUALT_Bualt16G0001500 [Buddleja alternifolia]